MMSVKYKGVFRKKLSSRPATEDISSLRKENAYLKMALVEMSHQHLEHFKLIEKFLSIGTSLHEVCQTLAATDMKIASVLEQLTKKEVNQIHTSSETLEKSRQWLERDQQREAYVKSILARMLWLEKQLHEANQAVSQRHKEDHSDGEPKGQCAVRTHHLGKNG